MWNTFAHFADNLAVVVAANQPENVKIYSTETIRVVKSWLVTLVRRKLVTLGDAKTEAVLVGNRRKKNIVKIEIGEHTVVSPSIKCLGALIDVKLNFKLNQDYVLILKDS